MDLMYESGLFLELGEVEGYDPVLYEDTQKQNFDTSLSTDALQEEMGGSIIAMDGAYVDTPLPKGNCELDSLLAEGNQLLDQLLSANGLDLPTDDPVDLGAIDEVSANMDYIQEHLDVMEEHEDLLADLENLAAPVDTYYPDVVSPCSSISTLPSECSSPVNLVPFQTHEEGEQDEQPPHELTDLLQSLLDGNDSSSPAMPDYDECYDNNLQSPTQSEQSCLTPHSQSIADEPWADDSISIYSSEVESAGKSKPKKKSKSTPYSKLPASRKERKKKQNKEAAIRYREKKRKEAKEVMGEEDALVRRNNELKTEVLNIEREIMCMKELLSDVFNIHSL